MIFGYVRTSTTDQKNSLAEQERKLRKAGATEVFIEERSGKSTANRPQLQAMLSKLREGDQVISTKLDRISRSVRDFLDVLNLIQEQGASLTFTDQQIDTESPAGKLMLNMLASFAEFERDMIRERVQAGVDKAKRDGKTLGRPRVDQSQNPKAKALRTLVDQGTSISEAARSIGVSRMTAHRWLKAVA
jgi:DNA invertase Pin-like site-specific DNA recombinase